MGRLVRSFTSPMRRCSFPGRRFDRSVRAFGAAIITGDVDALQRVLTDDAVLYPDGGGRVLSALRPIHGSDRVARFLFGVLKKFPLGDSARISERTINGEPGFWIEEGGRAVQTMAFDIRQGRIDSVYVVRNPDKLARLGSGAGH
jgi:RNA polymerase sigma-70 factor (ECF subfamily)